MRQRIGEILIAKGLLDADELDKALALQRERAAMDRDKLGKLLMEMGLISSRDLLPALAGQLGVPLVAARQFPAVAVDVPGVSPAFLRQYRILPLENAETHIAVAMADPLDYESQAALRQAVGRRVAVSLADEAELLGALEEQFPAEEETAPGEALGLSVQDEQELEHLRDLASEAPVIRVVNQIISRAVERRASDIHLEPMERKFNVRYRLDGVLHAVEAPPREMQAAIISRLKLMSKLNIAERRLPQDGRIQLKIVGREIDLRVSTLPTLHGESVVMRLLDRSDSARYSLTSLGFPEEMMRRIGKIAGLSYGMFLVTGPTGSGKSTTLYSTLRMMKTGERKVLTIEDPVEYQIDGVNQIHVNTQIGLTFAAGLRHIVRQDPDVIMVGEIRDRETAEIAVRAALTGHLVLSTLHTNDAASALARLADMGVERFLLTSSIVGILAQRLVRVLCAHCRRPAQAAPEWLEIFGLPGRPGGSATERAGGITHWLPGGCEHCNHTGYQGRVGIFELIEMNEELRRLVMAGDDAGTIGKAARGMGMKSLVEDGVDRVLSGVTSAEELLRVTQVF